MFTIEDNETEDWQAGTSISASAPMSLSATEIRPGLDITTVLNRVSEVIAPVWPLKDYVAVNPYAGLASKSFLDARAFLKVFSDCETLMPVDYFAERFAVGEFDLYNVAAAITEFSAVTTLPLPTLQEVTDALTGASSPAKHGASAAIRTYAEIASGGNGVDWTEVVRDELAKHCASHYDQGQAVWPSPVAHLSLYQAWRRVAAHDRNIEILGVRGFRKLVASLPENTADAIAELLSRIGVPNSLWSTFLLCQAFSVPGWCAWAKYRSSWREGINLPIDDANDNDLAGLLAMRLAYDVAIAETYSIDMVWSGLLAMNAILERPLAVPTDNNAMMRMVLLRANEIGFRNSLIGSLAVAEHAQEQPAPNGEDAKPSPRKLAQIVFCIDVRSERIRRHLESQSESIETFGFAGFFGMPIESVPLGQSEGDFNLPVLLRPKFQLHECVQDGSTASEAEVIGRRKNARTWRESWNEFQRSGVGCFSFVETNGLLYGWKLACRAIGWTTNSASSRFVGAAAQRTALVGPTLRGLDAQGVTLARQADLAESMLRNLGLTQDFASLVVLCGHASQTDNNPLSAGLDCGACGGHSGEPNAKLAVMLLNQVSIRTLLADRGIEIPQDTYFLAGLHNTTTDAVELFDVHSAPPSHHAAIRQLVTATKAASALTRQERMPIVASDTVDDLLQRASDWSEVRPEWGLAGNAAFIVAPRSLTRHANLDGRSFLHSYDWRTDPSGAVLETIMTAPMVVANWINMQYYASTVDNAHFGSGNKTVHNVVGRFGILSGNGGDLQTGLPWQSLHTGAEYQHAPLRLQVVIAAPRRRVDRIVNKHAMVADLVHNGWLHLVAIDGGVAYQRARSGEWQIIAAT